MRINQIIKTISGHWSLKWFIGDLSWINLLKMNNKFRTENRMLRDEISALRLACGSQPYKLDRSKHQMVVSRGIIVDATEKWCEWWQWVDLRSNIGMHFKDTGCPSMRDRIAGVFESKEYIQCLEEGSSKFSFEYDGKRMHVFVDVELERFGECVICTTTPTSPNFKDEDIDMPQVGLELYQKGSNPLD